MSCGFKQSMDMSTLYGITKCHQAVLQVLCM